MNGGELFVIMKTDRLRTETQRLMEESKKTIEIHDAHFKKNLNKLQEAIKEEEQQKADDAKRLQALEKQVDKAGETKTIATKLHKNDRCILQALANSKERIYQVDLEQITHLTRKTISKRLKKLQNAGYVSYPEGERGGIEITEVGKNALLGTTQ